MLCAPHRTAPKKTRTAQTRIHERKQTRNATPVRPPFRTFAVAHSSRAKRFSSCKHSSFRFFASPPATKASFSCSSSSSSSSSLKSNSKKIPSEHLRFLAIQQCARFLNKNYFVVSCSTICPFSFNSGYTTLVDCVLMVPSTNTGKQPPLLNHPAHKAK